MHAGHGARAIAFALAAIAIQCVMITAYAWPAARLTPRHLPVMVAGSAAPAAQIAHQQPAEFDVIRVASEATARQAIIGRRAYGAIIVGGKAPLVLTASAASPVVAQLLTQAAGQMSGVIPPVRDVVPIDPHDPHGAAFGSMLLPLVITGIIAAVLLTLLAGSVPWRLAGLAAFAVGGGAATVAIAQSWLSVLPGQHYAVAAVAGLIALARVWA